MINPIVAEARKLIGKPFRHLGRGPTHYDCVGLCAAAVSAATGMVIIDVAGYPREPSKDSLRQAVERNAGPPASMPPQPGDVAMLRFAGVPHHLAIIGDYPGGGLSIIHAYGAVKRVTEHRLCDVWRERIISVYRVPV